MSDYLSCFSNGTHFETRSDKCLTYFNSKIMQTGHIGVTSTNLFPIIKKFLYSDHDIFLREIISNGVDATQKLKTLASVGTFTDELGDLTIEVNVDKEAKTITVSDKGIGMTEEEIEKYINQIAFSSAEEFIDKYKDKANAIIGHFGLGFYSSFMVSSKVEIVTKSYKHDAKAMKWSCDGTPEYTLEPSDKVTRGTDIIMHISDEEKDFLEENKIKELLEKYCKFLPIEIAFGKKKEWKDGKEVETDELNLINDVNPAWTRKPADLNDEDYKTFYNKLYPYAQEPLFHIHINVDYPFNLTGILYFPKLKNNLEIQKNKIQLYCNQVFVTDSVEGIVPEFLTLLHGVIDSPDIPLNVSRSYLQSDSNVKKISGHINKKVADSLNDIFKKDRNEFEKKWDDLKLFMQYGMISDEKFYERVGKFALLKNTENKYFTFEEYEKLIKENQTDKNKKLVYLYASDIHEQYSYIEAAKLKGYDVLLMDSQLDPHFINKLESKLTDATFTRVDADIVDKLIQKEDKKEVSMSIDNQGDLTVMFQNEIARDEHFMVMFESMSETDLPIVITQSEFMRRMKDMSALGGGMGMYGNFPGSYNFVINTNHELVKKIVDLKQEKVGVQIEAVKEEMKPFNEQKVELTKKTEGKDDEEILQADKDKLEEVNSKLDELRDKKEEILKNHAKEQPLIKQMIDLALLANGMLKGEELTKFVRRSVGLLK